MKTRNSIVIGRARSSLASMIIICILCFQAAVVSARTLAGPWGGLLELWTKRILISLH